MWRNGFVWVVFFYWMIMVAKGQSTADSLLFVEGPYIEVGRNVTTNLVFHYRIRQVDRGTGGLLARACNDTVLLLRAASSTLPVTNLSVYTSDGRLHCFWVRYAERPSHPWVRLEDSSSIRPPVSNVITYTEDRLIRLCDSVWLMATDRHGISDKQYRLRWRLRGVYARSGLLFFPLELVNHSSIDYDLERVRFVIRDKRRVRRVATQEREIAAVYVRGDTSVVCAGSSRQLVFVLPAFTAPGKRSLHIAVEEKGGGRELSVEVGSRKLMKAARID